MIVQGQVQNGIVIFDNSIQVPDGQQVTVFIPSPSDESRHSILDIPKISVGSIVDALTSDDDLLDELLAGRP